MKYKTLEFNNEKPLHEEWNEEIVISYNEVKRLLQIFKNEKLTKEHDAIILKEKYSNIYRIVGEQHKYKMIMSEKTYNNIAKR